MISAAVDRFMYIHEHEILPHACKGNSVKNMLRYWEPALPVKKSRSSTANRIIVVVVILFLLVGTSAIMLLSEFPFGDSNSTEEGKVRVAVVDSGINIDFTLQGKVVEQKTFVLTQYGYDRNETSLRDSNPEDTPHGTIVSKTIVQNSLNSVLVNAKVLGADGTATVQGLVAAIHWAVEQNCSVINLSLGSFPSFGDPLEETVKWAFSHGVVLVGVGGNEGEEGVAGTSISSPSAFIRLIATK